MLVQTTRRERILVYGSFKTGKTFNWIDIAELYHQTETPGTFYVIDTDFGVSKMLDEGYEHLEESGRLKVYTPLEFAEILDASKEIYRSAKKGDWIVIDMLNYLWGEAQDYYIRNVFGEDPSNYFLQMRKEVKAKGNKDARAYGGQEGTDWGFITKIYNQAEYPLTMKSAANVFSVAEERKIDADRGDSKEKVKQFKGTGGMAPVGQKGIGHRHDTLLRMTKRANGQRQLTMAGDRGRENSVWEERGSKIINIDEPPEAFAKRYLVDVAGWKLEKKKGGKSKPRSSGKKPAGSRRRR